MTPQDSLEDCLKTEYSNPGALSLLRELSTWDILNWGSILAADQEGHVLASSLVSQCVQYIYGKAADGADATVESAQRIQVHQRFSEAFDYVTSKDANYGNLVLSSLPRVAHHLAEDKIHDWINVGMGLKQVNELTYLTDRERTIITPMPSTEKVKEQGQYIIDYFGLKDGSAGKNLLDFLQGKMASMNLTARPGGQNPLPGASASGAATSSSVPKTTPAPSSAAPATPAGAAAPLPSTVVPASPAPASLKDTLLKEFGKLDHSGILKVPPSALERYADDVVEYAVPLRGEKVIHDVAQKAKDLERYNVKFPFAFLSNAGAVYNQLDPKHVGEFIRRGLGPYLDYQKLSPDKRQSGVYTAAVNQVVDFFSMDAAGDKALQELKVQQQRGYEKKLSNWKFSALALGTSAAAFLGLLAYKGYTGYKTEEKSQQEISALTEKSGTLTHQLEEANQRFDATYPVKVQRALDSDDPTALHRVVDEYLADVGGELLVRNLSNCELGLDNLRMAMGLRGTPTSQKFIDRLKPVYCPGQIPDKNYMRFKLNRSK